MLGSWYNVASAYWYPEGKFLMPGATVWNGSSDPVLLETNVNGPAGLSAVSTPSSCGVLP